MKNIVLTGGPCSGKSTSIVEIKSALEKRGYKVFIVDEAATRLIKKNITPVGDNAIGMYKFQKKVANLQLHSETIVRFLAKFYKKSIILYDRGIMDGKAYLNELDWNVFINENKYDEAKFLNRYDQVIHLVTVADGKKELYTTANNEARRESCEEALEMDKRTLSSWIGHPNLCIVDNSTNFENKIRRTINFILSYLGEEEAIKQYKFLVNIDKTNMDKLVAISKKSYIIQNYLKTDEYEEMRVRKTVYNGKDFYYLTIKKKLVNGEIVKTSKKLSQLEYKSLLKKKDDTLKTLEKTRYYFMNNKNVYTIDVFDNGEAILEIETSKDISEVKVPKFISIRGEVKTTNKQMAKKKSR